MADLIELDLVVRDKGLKASISTVERLERQIIKAAKAVDQNSISQVRYNKILLSTKREYKELGLSSQKATSTVRAFAAAQRKATAEAAKENKVRVEQIKLYKQARAEAERENQSRSNSIKEQVRQEASLERLRAKYKPLYAASKQYETALNEINQAHKLGVISIGQQTAAVDRLNSEYKQGTGIFSQYSAQARRGTNQLGVAVQQTGYQVGDFLVQVQSGTNPLVAFGQQATQLVGILPLVATQLGLTAMAAIGISTALGIGIPLVTALGAAFMRTKKPAQNLEEIMSDLSSAVGDYSSNMESASLSTDDLNSKFGAFGDTAKGVLETMLEISRVKIQESVQAVSALGPLSPKALQSISESGTLQTVQQDVVSEMFPVIKTLLGKMSTRNDGRGMAAEFATMLINLEKSEGTDKQLAVLEEISQFTLDVGGQYEDMTDRQKEFFDKVTEAQDLLLKAVEAEQAVVLRAQEDKKKVMLRNHNIMLAWQKQIGQGQKERDKPGPKGPKLTTMEGPIKALERQIELSEALFGLQGTARREEQIYMQLKFQNQDADIKAGKEELELLAERVALEEQRTEAEQMNLKNISPLKKYVAEYAKLVKLKDSGLGDEAFAKEVAKLNEELAKSNPLLNSFTDAFADFLGRGARDFKSFAKDILNDFKSMLIQMITTAARNKIMFSMGMGGGALGTAAAAGGGGSFASQAGGSIIGSVAKSAFGSIIQGGFTGASAFGAGVTTSLGLGTTGAAAINGAVAQALSPTMYAIGSLAGPLLAVGAVFSFLRTKTKELDSGLRVTVDNMDVLVKTFRTIQKSRFWGLSKKVRTTEEEASSEVSDPIVNAVATIQESVMEAASAFGVASDKFDDFTYDFEVSLKGLTEDQKLEKLNEEFTKLGDSFTEMSGLFSNMNDLMAVYQQRLDLENQLLVAQGEVVKLREQELETINVLNRELASRLHILQAETDMQSALTAFASGISEQQGLIRRAVDALVKPLQEAIDRTRTQAEKSYNIFKTAADKSVDSAKNIVDIITSALDSRTIISESAELMRYQTAQKQLASFAGGASFDEASLRRATEGVSIDSQKFFGSFEDYARDFYRTQINLEDLAAVAEKELSEVEQQIDIAQKAYEVAMGTHQEAVDLNTAIETLAQDLNIYEATKLANEPLIKMVQDEGNLQIELLDSILVETTKQVNTQLGIESSMADLVGNTVSIGEAMGVLGLEAESLTGGVLALEDIERDINGNVTDLGLYVVDFDGSVKKLDASVFDLTGTVDDLDGDIKTLFYNINLLDGAIDNLDGGIDGFGTKVDELGVSTDDLGIDITNLGTTLTSAMTSLGSIVSSLSNAVSGLSASNNNLAAAEQSKAIANITATAAGVNAEIANLESSIGTTATGATPEQESQLASLQAQLKEEQSKDGEDRNLGTGHYSILIKLLNQEIAAQVGPAEMSPEDSATLANLTADLEALRGQIRDLGGTPTFSSGGYHSGGMRLVGENGPELEATGPSRIYSAQQTRNMLSGGSGEVVVELRSLRREVSELKAEQRKVGVENVKYNKKSYDLYREWDTVGLPATRTA